nr:MAG TPA: pentapeptide repeat protein [Caudoviricetes sp.]
MKQEQIEKILEEHKAWLNRTGGVKADLCGTDLRGAGLCGADLCGTDLRDADLCGTDLRDADLRDADLRDANLCGADLCGADLRGVRHDERTAFYAMQCPEKGAYIGYKKAGGKIVELEIQEDAKRSSATTRKCRASKAKVLSITSIDGEEHFEEAKSNYDNSFVYEVGETVEVKDFDENRWNECSTGIHHFITREEAERY